MDLWAEVVGTNEFPVLFESLETTERYLGAEQDFVSAVNDKLGLDRE